MHSVVTYTIEIQCVRRSTETTRRVSSATSLTVALTTTYHGQNMARQTWSLHPEIMTMPLNKLGLYQIIWGHTL